MGLSPVAAGAHAHSDAVHGPGIDRAARNLHWSGPWRADPSAIRPWLGAAFDIGANCRCRRIVDHGVHRRRGRRRTVRPLAGFHAAPRCRDPPHHRGQRVLQAGRACGLDRRPVRTGVLCRCMGRPPGPQGAGAGRDRSAAQEPRFSVHGRGDHRRDLQPMDDLLPAVGDGGEEIAPERSHRRPMGHRRRRDSDPVPHRRGAGRGRRGVCWRRRVVEPLDSGRDQRRADSGHGRADRPDCVHRRRARGVAHRGDRLLSGAGLGRRRSDGLPAFAGVPAVRRAAGSMASTRPAS